MAGKISVIIPTLNAGLVIGPLLDSLREQSVCCEVVVVDSSSPDDTVRVASSLGARTLTIDRRDFDHGRTRNLGGRAANGDILVYMTQDAFPADRSSIENLIRPILTDEKTGAAFGRQLPYQEATAFAAHLRLFNYPESSSRRSLADKARLGLKAAFISNAFAAYRREALDQIGWFPEGVIMGEDMLAGARMLLNGFELAYEAGSAVYHSHNYGVFQEFRRYFDIGVFHAREEWLLREFGTAGGEGGRYILSELSYILSRRCYHLIPEWAIRNGLKFAGYELGSVHRRLPVRFSRRLSMNPDWGKWASRHK